MRIEIPELKRCCFCLPLRRGLLAWVYFKLIFALLVLPYFILSLVYDNHASTVIFYILTTITIIFFFMELAFGILFLISAHRKNHEHMRIYYRYAIGILIFEFLVMLTFIGLSIYTAIILMPFTLFIIRYMVQFVVFTIMQTAVQGYLVILVRSELLKLEKGTKFEFTNYASEPVCKVQILDGQVV